MAADAEIRISSGDIAKIEAAQRRLEDAVTKLDARQIEQITRFIAGRLDAAVSRVLADFEEITSQLGVTDPEEKRRIKRGLETIDGATSAAKDSAGFLAALPLPPQVRLGVLAAAAGLGALEGANRENTRRSIDRVRQAEQDSFYELEQRVRAFDDDGERRRAALRRARSGR